MAHAADPEFPRLGKEGDFSLAPPVLDEGPGHGWYARLDGGWLAPDLGGVSTLGAPLAVFSEPGSGWSVGGGLGYKFLSLPVRLEVGIDYLSIGTATTAAGNVGLSATVALASAYWDIITISGFTPYLSGGVGLSINALDGPAGLAVSDNDYSFAYTFGGGVSYAIDSRWSVDLGYRYLNLGSATADAPAGGPVLEVDNVSAHQVRIGVRYALQ